MENLVEIYLEQLRSLPPDERKAGQGWPLCVQMLMEIAALPKHERLALVKALTEEESDFLMAFAHSGAEDAVRTGNKT